MPLLAPAQQRALESLLRTAERGRPAVLHANPGMGRTTILRRVHEQLGGAMVTAADVMAALQGCHPLAIEDAVYDLLSRAVTEHRVVIVDDFQLVIQVAQGHFYPRHQLLEVALTALVDQAAANDARLVFGTDCCATAQAWGKGERTTVRDFEVPDYEAVLRESLGAERAAALDVVKIRRFARKLTARQLCRAAESFVGAAPDTDAFIDYLRRHQLVSNVDLGEVQAVSLYDLKGVDDVIRALEANVILPLENTELAERFALKAKRGVLLAGPPGTGKTTVGRALAHRLRSKFFLIDGTLIAGTPQFYGQLHHIFEAAKQNAPAIIFIDDSDVIFESGGEPGLYRYLLTMLDGLESESAGAVCLMMTAMDVSSLPPALVRSGRIELWLDMRLPDEAARAAILEAACASLPREVGAVDVPRLAASTEELSGADLKRLVDDGKLLFAYDAARGLRTRPAVEYFLAAADTVRANKARYAEAEARARAHRPNRPPMFDVAMGANIAFVHGMMASGMEAGGMEALGG